jgi:ATP-dependent DNA helicase PIF1
MGKSRISTSSVGQLSSLIPETGKNDTESILIGTTASNSSRAPSEDEVSLSEAQKRVLDVIMQRKSVFFSGAAGTGKSFVLKILQDVLDRLKLNSVVAFTAPTGVAACNIKGMTVHAWSGVGLAKESLEKLVAQVSRSREARKRWAEAEILVIDEISMLSAELFDIMSKVGSRVRNDPRPFGGLQVILCGDFFQLPPVGLGRNCRFCFESEVWSQLLCEPDSMIVLDKVFRQKDSGFREMLNKIRRGIVDPPTVQQLNKKVAEYRLAQTRGENNMNEDGETKIRSTKLFSKNDKVDAFNTHELGKLDNGPGNAMSFEALDEGTYD